MEDIIKYSTGTKWEELTGYSRAIKIGNEIITSGTTATDETGKIVGVNDPYLQTKVIIEKAEKILKELGAELKNVIKTVIYITDISKWEEAAKAHGEFFSEIKPACTLVEVKGFIKEDWLVEMEADCVIGH